MNYPERMGSHALIAGILGVAVSFDSPELGAVLFTAASTFGLVRLAESRVGDWFLDSKSPKKGHKRFEDAYTIGTDRFK